MASMSKEEYLKKYLSSGDSSENKKRKKKRHKNSAKGSGLKIVDDDVDFKALLPDNLTNTLEEDVGDNDPTVAAFIDERPEDVQQLEKFRSDGRWKTLGDGEGEEENSYASQHRHSSKTMSSDKQFRLKADKRTHDSDSDSALESKGNIRHKRHDSDSDNSLPRRVRHDSSDSDMSPPRSKTANHSPVHRKRNDSDSDISVSRNKKGQSDSDQSPPRGRHDSSDSDQSPQRAKHKRSDSDQSPPRGRRQSSDSDQSPPRKRGKSSSNISSHSTSTNKKSKPDDHKQRKSRWGDEKDEQGRVKQTLSGAKAGLSSAKEMAAEAVKIRAKEDAAFKKLDATLLGKDAATIIRDKSGRKRNLEAEGDDPETKAKKEAQKEQYQQWGKGLKQQELQDSMIADALHEVSKPLARAKDDADLDALLKEKDREGDPMLAFMKKKKEKGKKTVMPTYKGKEPEPNRFGIRPGYRWDGVDRSNGFERKFFLKINERKAMKDIAHKWSVEDM